MVPAGATPDFFQSESGAGSRSAKVSAGVIAARTTPDLGDGRSRGGRPRGCGDEKESKKGEGRESKACHCASWVWVYHG